jgi:hypothetical protein
MPGYSVFLLPDDVYDPQNWPDTEVGNKMKRLGRRHPIEFQDFDNNMRLIQDESIGKQAFQDRTSLRIISNLGSVCSREHSSLWEVRCPKTRRSGVLRIYFTMSTIHQDTLVILDGEFKDETSANYSTACSRLREGSI